MPKFNRYKSSYYYKILIWVLSIAVIPLFIVGLLLGTQLFNSLAQRAVQIETLALSQSVMHRPCAYA